MFSDTEKFIVLPFFTIFNFVSYLKCRNKKIKKSKLSKEMTAINNLINKKIKILLINIFKKRVTKNHFFLDFFFFKNGFVLIPMNFYIR